MAKLAASRSAAYVRAPDSAHAAMLLYGPDSSQISARRAELVTSLLGVPDDPFRLARLSGEQLRREPSLLSDEFNAISFGGDERVIVLESGTDSLTGPISALFDDGPGASRLIVTAGTLPASSKLRKWFEGAGMAVALPFYPPEGHALETVFEELLHRHGAPRLDPGARDALGHAIAGMQHGEVERFAEVVALHAMNLTSVDADIIAACAPSAAETDFDSVIQAVAQGRTKAIPGLIERLVTQGLSLAGLLRVLSGYFFRLHRAQALMQSDSLDPNAAMAKLRPPVFFRQRDVFASQLRTWPHAGVEAALQRLNELEADLRSGATLPERALIERTLMRVAMSAPGARSRR